MKAKELIIRCYAKKEEDVWVAVCLDFCLATQGDSFDEVKHKLEEQINDYVTEALQDKEYGVQLLNRKAPFSSWLEYYWIRVSNVIHRGSSVIFDELMPLHPA
ncbi:MAG: DUF1902 domain-containing protein [Gammaproteobacteria bacterium]